MVDEQHLLNQIKLLKMALEFYAEEANYVNNQIFNDKGFIARNTLDRLSILNNEIRQSQELFDKIQKIKTDNNIDDTGISDTDLINILGKLDELNNKLNT